MRSSNQAEVRPSPRRLSPDELDPELADALGPRVERLGYLGEFFTVAAHQPAVLQAFIAFTDAAKAAVPDDLVELIALTAASRLANDYERHQHERLAVRLGLGRDWVAAVERLDPDDPRLTSVQAATQRYVLAALQPTWGVDANAALESLDRTEGPETAVGVLFVTARYAAHALIANSLGLVPPVPSIFEDGFDG